MRTLSASTALVTGACLLALALAQLIGAQPTAAAGTPPARRTWGGSTPS
jgi:hypothetical protein